MDRYFFMRRMLELLNQPGFLNKLVAITLRAVGGLIVLLSLVAFFNAGKTIFNLPASGILGGILFLFCYILAIYGVVHTLIIRARNIDEIIVTEFTTFPLVALLLKTFGEVFAAFATLVAIGGGLYVWFTGKSVETILDTIHKFLPSFSDTSFMGGIQFIVGGVLSAMGVLLLCYMLAEVVTVFSEIAKRRAEAQRLPDQTYKFRSRT
ncbi:MAG: hypothetical protein ACYDDO_09180 [Acidiferrobacterales bacterium]